MRISRLPAVNACVCFYGDGRLLVSPGRAKLTRLFLDK